MMIRYLPPTRFPSITRIGFGNRMLEYYGTPHLSPVGQARTGIGSRMEVVLGAVAFVPAPVPSVELTLRFYLPLSNHVPQPVIRSNQVSVPGISSYD